MKTLLLTMCMTLLGGSLLAKDVTLVSNEENTRFRWRTFGEQQWHEGGTGKIVHVNLGTKSAYEFTAQAPGYIEKKVTLTELVGEVQFTFMIGDKGGGSGGGSRIVAATKPKATKTAESKPAAAANAPKPPVSTATLPVVSKRSVGVVD